MRSHKSSTCEATDDEQKMGLDSGHTLRGSKDCIARRALGWNPQGSKRGEGDRVTAGGERDHTIQSRGLSWHQLEHLSRDRGGWRDFVSGLCSDRDGMIKASDQIRSDSKYEIINGLCHVILGCSGEIFS